MNINSEAPPLNSEVSRPPELEADINRIPEANTSVHQTLELEAEVDRIPEASTNVHQTLELEAEVNQIPESNTSQAPELANQSLEVGTSLTTEGDKNLATALALSAEEAKEEGTGNAESDGVSSDLENENSEGHVSDSGSDLSFGSQSPPFFDEVAGFASKEEREEEERKKHEEIERLIKREDSDSDDPFETDPRKQKWSESLKARLFGSADKDGNYFFYMFLDKIFGESRPCVHCGARGSAKLPPGDNSLQLCVIEEGIIGKQNIMCEKCGGKELVISGDDPTLLPQDPRLSIKGAEIRDYCKKITHFEVLHDIMEMLHIAAMDNSILRKEKHLEVGEFMLHNARKVCEEWCRPENSELRQRKYLRLREETLLSKYKPTFTPDCTEEYKEMYEMMAQSFRQNRTKIMILLQLLKESLIDSPSRSTFMMWLSLSMMHSENYPKFKRMYDPRSFMRVESAEYHALRERYLSLDVPLGIKKIPVIFVLFELPRFYHYVEFLNQRLGKRKPRSILTDMERAELAAIDEEASKMGAGRAARRRGKKNRTMVSPEAHFDYLTKLEEVDREKVYESCREKNRAKAALGKYGRDRNKKSLPKSPLDSIEAIPRKHPPKEQASPPLALEPPSKDKVADKKGKDTEGGEIMDKSGDEPGLTKAQIKRRRKKALAAVAAAKAEAEHLEVEKDDVSQPANKENIKKKDDNLKSSTVGGKKGKKGSGESSSTQRPSSLDTSKGGLKVSHVSPDTVQALDSLLSGAATAKVASKSSSSSAHKLVTSKSPTKYTIPPSKSESSSVSASSKSASKNGTKAGNKPIPPAKAAAVGVPKSVSKLYKPTAEVSRPPGNYTSTASRILNEAKAKDLFRAENDSPMAQVEQAKTKKVLSEAAANSETDMSEEAVEELIQDLSALSYPVIADLLESVNTLPSSPPKSDPSQTHRPKNVSVLADPFCMLTDGSTEPDQGAIAFVKRKTKVSPPPRRALPSSDPTHSKDAKENGPAALDSSLVPATSGATGSKGPESDSDGARNDTPMTDRLSYLLSELSKESKDEEEKVMDYTFHSMSSSLLPKRLRDLVESEERGEAMEPMIISQEEYQEMLVNLKEHGTSHVEGESKDTESVLCLPSQLNLDAELLTELSREFIGVCEEKEEEEVVEVEEEIDEEAEEEIAQKIYDTIRTRLAESRGLTPSSSSSAAKEQQKAKPKAAVSKAKPKPPKPMFPNAGADSMQMPGFETTSSFAPKLGTKYDRNSSRRAKREAIRNARKTLKHPSDHHAVMVTQVDTDILRRQGFDVKTDSGTATVIANKEGAIIHVLEGEQTPDQVKDFLSKRYNIVAQQSGPGVITMPTKDHPGGLLIDPKLTPSEEIPGDKFVGNRKKMRNKKRAIQEKQYSSLTRWPMPRPTNPYSIPLGIWATQGGDWPEGLDYGTEYHSDREVICESDDDDLVKALDRDSFGNHSMLMRLELNSVDAPDEKAAETVMNRYMEPADLGPGIDPKVPRYIIPSGGGGGSPGASKKLPVGTTKKDVPILMKYAAPHKQMRALDAMRIPYKYELTQVLTPHLNDEGEVVPHFPKRIAILSKITLLPKSRYRSLNPPTEEETKEEEKPPEEQEKEVKEEAAPKISKSQRKRMKKKMKLAQQNSEEGATGGIAEDPALPEDDLALDPDEIVHSKHDQPPEMMEDDEDSSDESRSHTVAREKFKYCENCGQEITSRILLCAGCKKVAYCNYRCQKASWKVHKKTCSYALRKDGKESTG